ncbi:hypothetical protein BGZ94_010095 [Podila epigama]|nr:hypothetical protein BGZ94_010095 [Podila epigama]
MVNTDIASLPSSGPLKSFKELLAWQPGNDEHNVAHTPLHPRPRPRSTLLSDTDPSLLRSDSSLASLTVDAASVVHNFGLERQSLLAPSNDRAHWRDCRVIVCHDMAGGYKEDASPQGNDFSTVYSIQYWAHIDTFIYFSHYRVTIPPPVWTNAAHRNGVRCLGTIITEWLEGILETEELVTGPGQVFTEEPNDVDRQWFSRIYADKLESILRGGARQANQMISFLRYLRSQIHKRIPGGELIWYDSVITSTGEIAWQDKLSPENYGFFEQSDGIFTNYTWKENSVGESVKLAGSRNRDVYTGIDVWGRNTFGGGGYSTFKALQVIQRERTSCAIFAPAWTYESLGKDNFMSNDQLFWSGYDGAGIHAENLAHPTRAFTDLVKGDGTKCFADSANDATRIPTEAYLPVSAFIPARPSGCSHWFYSNFDRGFGKVFWVNGKIVSKRPWSNLSHQSLPPSMTKDVFSLDKRISSQEQPRARVRWVLSPEDAYQGGTSILIQEVYSRNPNPPPTLPPSLPAPPPPPPPPSQPPETQLPAVISKRTSFSKTILVPLYDVHIELLGTESSTVEVVYKLLQEDVKIGLHLGMVASNTLTRFNSQFLKVNNAVTLKGKIPQTSFLQDQGLVAGKKNVLATVASGSLSDANGPGHWIEMASQDNGRLYTVESLQTGWQKLSIHLSSLFNLGQYDDGGLHDQDDSKSAIILSQLGVTLAYESSVPDDEDLIKDNNDHVESLVLLGSLAVLPTRSLHVRGSSVQGLTSRNTRLQVNDQPDTPLLKGENQGSQLRVSSSLAWSVGYPILGTEVLHHHGGETFNFVERPRVGQSTARDTETETEVHSTDYSHYCIYLSTVDDPYGAQFIGTSFTTVYVIVDVEIPMTVKSQSEPIEVERSEQEPQTVWAWVQGIRRDGQADSAHYWAKCSLHHYEDK